MTDIDDWAARHAYESGTDPVAHAEKRVATVIEVNLQVIGGRFCDPEAFPLYSRDTGTGALSRRILGLLLDLGWTPPDTGPPVDLTAIPGDLDDLDGQP